MRVVLRALPAGVDHRHREHLRFVPHHHEHDAVPATVRSNPPARRHPQIPHTQAPDPVHPGVEELKAERGACDTRRERTKQEHRTDLSQSERLEQAGRSDRVRRTNSGAAGPPVELTRYMACACTSANEFLDSLGGHGTLLLAPSLQFTPDQRVGQTKPLFAVHFDDTAFSKSGRCSVTRLTASTHPPKNRICEKITTFYPNQLACLSQPSTAAPTKTTVALQ